MFRFNPFFPLLLFLLLLDFLFSFFKKKRGRENGTHRIIHSRPINLRIRMPAIGPNKRSYNSFFFLVHHPRTFQFAILFLMQTKRRNTPLFSLFFLPFVSFLFSFFLLNFCFHPSRAGNKRQDQNNNNKRSKQPNTHSNRSTPALRKSFKEKRTEKFLDLFFVFLFP